MKVKICGVRTVKVALESTKAGADFLGFNFAPVSKRRVDPEVARSAIRACSSLSHSTQMVGVFVNQPIHEVAEIARDLGLDYVQFSGDEGPDACIHVATRVQKLVIKAVRLARPAEASQIEALGGVSDILLADASAEGSYGGSGTPWQWQDASGVAQRFKVLLAGGLIPANVADAIAAASPWGVDVASGVETDGTTDPDKVRAFIASAKSTTKGNTNGHHR